MVNKYNHRVPIHYKEYLTSGFLSIQAAIDGYVLGLPSSESTSLGPLNTSTGSPAGRLYTEWSSVFPTAQYDYNDFYDG